MKKITIGGISLLSCMLFSTGCSFLPIGTNDIAIEPTEITHTTKSKSEKQEKSEAQVVYLFDEYGYVIPYSAPVSEKGNLKGNLQKLVKGSDLESSISLGFRLPFPEGTKFQKAEVKNGTAYVDVNAKFLAYGASDERKMIEALVYTATEQPGVNNVHLSVNGMRIETMPLGKTPLPKQLDRQFGINTVLEDNGAIYQTTQATVYYLKESGSLAYYVPVTRRISVNTSFEQGVFAAMQEGVPGSDDLVSEVNFDAVLRSVDINGKNIVLDFNENIYTTPDKKQLSTTLLECLALTFANGQRDTTFTVKVNGANEVYNENGKSVTTVMLPTELNRFIAL